MTAQQWLNQISDVDWRLLWEVVVCCVWLPALLGTIDFQLDDGTVVFRTCEAERDKVVFQVVCFIIVFCCTLCLESSNCNFLAVKYWTYC